MAEHTEKSQSMSLRDEDFSTFLAMLDNMFPDDYSNEKSKGYKKAEYAFAMFRKDGWTPEELEYVRKKFSREWQYQVWMPANLYEIWKAEFESSRRMVM